MSECRAAGCLCVCFFSLILVRLQQIAAKVAPEEKDTIVRKRWSKVKHSLHPTQTALGWDWVLFKMKNLADPEMAQAYLDRKPVPAVKRGDVYYVIDHHHTLAALEASGLDVKVSPRRGDVAPVQHTTR